MPVITLSTTSSGSTVLLRAGTELLGYLDYVGEEDNLPADSQPTFTMDLTDLLSNEDFQFFYPFTTTLIEVVINREPKPFREQNSIAWFM